MSTLERHVGLIYSYLNALTGSSLAAFLAGYKPKRMQMTTPKIRAPIAHSGEKIGVMMFCCVSGFWNTPPPPCPPPMKRDTMKLNRYDSP
jgi:hypothetical protein